MAQPTMSDDQIVEYVRQHHMVSLYHLECVLPIGRGRIYRLIAEGRLVCEKLPNGRLMPKTIRAHDPPAPRVYPVDCPAALVIRQNGAQQVLRVERWYLVECESCINDSHCFVARQVRATRSQLIVALISE